MSTSTAWYAVLRGGTLYKCKGSDLKTTIQPGDLFAVQANSGDSAGKWEFVDIDVMRSNDWLACTDSGTTYKVEGEKFIDLFKCWVTASHGGGELTPKIIGYRNRYDCANASYSVDTKRYYGVDENTNSAYRFWSRDINGSDVKRVSLPTTPSSSYRAQKCIIDRKLKKACVITKDGRAFFLNTTNAKATITKTVTISGRPSSPSNYNWPMIGVNTDTNGWWLGVCKASETKADHYMYKIDIKNDAITVVKGIGGNGASKVGACGGFKINGGWMLLIDDNEAVYKVKASDPKAANATKIHAGPIHSMAFCQQTKLIYIIYPDKNDHMCCEHRDLTGAKTDTSKFYDENCNPLTSKAGQGWVFKNNANQIMAAFSAAGYPTEGKRGLFKYNGTTKEWHAMKGDCPWWPEWMRSSSCDVSASWVKNEIQIPDTFGQIKRYTIPDATRSVVDRVKDTLRSEAIDVESMEVVDQTEELQ